MNGIFLLVPFTALVISQLLKFAVESLKCGELKWNRLFNGTGGIPSSHSAFCVSLTCTVGIKEGFFSSLFAISLIFSIIFMYDATHLRRESGKHAEELNKLTNNNLNECLGHNPLEVLFGIIIGILTSLCYCMFL